MFAGMVCVLTSSTNRERDPSWWCLAETSGLHGQFSEDKQPFVKREIKYLIAQLGGRNVENMGVNVADTKQALSEGRAYCITDTYYRTTKYLLSLAAGARLLSHKWVLDSVIAVRVDHAFINIISIVETCTRQGHVLVAGGRRS
jgi:hypothetical protein